MFTNGDYTLVNGFGSGYETVTFFKTKDNNIEVNCNYFVGPLGKFMKTVKEKHGEGRRTKEYLIIANLMKYHFN